MNGAGANLDDFEAALKTMGPSKIVECFVKAEAYLEANKGNMSDGEIPEPMTAKQWKVDNDEEDDEDELPAYKPDLFHVPKNSFEALKSKLSAKQELTTQEVDELVNWTGPDTEVLVPVDMNGADEDLDDFDEMLAKLGPKTILECFVQAEKHLEKKRDLLSTEQLKQMTIGQWKSSEFNDEEDDEEKPVEEDEDDDEDDADEDDDEGDDDEDEPQVKKAKH